MVMALRSLLLIVRDSTRKKRSNDIILLVPKGGRNVLSKAIGLHADIYLLHMSEHATIW